MVANTDPSGEKERIVVGRAVLQLQMHCQSQSSSEFVSLISKVTGFAVGTENILSINQFHQRYLYNDGWTIDYRPTFKRVRL